MGEGLVKLITCRDVPGCLVDVLGHPDFLGHQILLGWLSTKTFQESGVLDAHSRLSRMVQPLFMLQISRNCDKYNTWHRDSVQHIPSPGLLPPLSTEIHVKSAFANMIEYGNS